MRSEMVALYPENPNFADPSEALVWDALIQTLPDSVHIVYSCRFTNDRGDQEGDIVVIWPTVGIAVMEVKGGHITPLPNGTFSQSNALGQTKTVDPIGNSQNIIYEIRNWVLKHSSYTHWFNTLAFAAFPYVHLNAEYHTTLASREQFVDKDDLANIATQLKRALENKANNHWRPDEIDAARIAQSLVNYVDDVTDISVVATLVDQRTEAIERFARQNEVLLDFVQEVPRFDLRGPAGTGKTSLAIAQGHRKKAQGKRVLFLCYSRLLAAYLRHQREKEQNHIQNIDVIQTFHNFAVQWGLKVPQNPTQEFWNLDAAHQLKGIALSTPISEKFDVVIVDEAQDFAEPWWAVIPHLLRDPARGNIFSFGDDGQNIFDRHGASSASMVPLRLSLNLRNSKPIAEFSAQFTSTSSSNLGIIGPKVAYLEVDESQDLIDYASEAVETTLEYFNAKDVALLTTQHRHQVHKELSAKGDAYYERELFYSRDIFYSTVAKFKGLDRACIVLVVDGFHENVDPQQCLYTGMTRARDMLVIVSKRKTLEPILTSNVMNQLRENPFHLLGGYDISNDEN